jgi:hypothetical protein
VFIISALARVAVMVAVVVVLTAAAQVLLIAAVKVDHRQTQHSIPLVSYIDATLT